MSQTTSSFDQPRNSHDPLDLIIQYVNAAKEASGKSRFLLVILVTASVLGFVAEWNSYSQHWIAGRIQLADTAHQACTYYLTQPSAPIPSSPPKIFQNISKEAWKNAISYYNLDKGIPTQEFCNNIETRRAYLSEIQTKEIINVKIPFF